MSIKLNFGVRNFANNHGNGSPDGAKGAGTGKSKSNRPGKKSDVAFNRNRPASRLRTYKKRQVDPDNKHQEDTKPLRDFWKQQAYHRQETRQQGGNEVPRTFRHIFEGGLKARLQSGQHGLDNEPLSDIASNSLQISDDNQMNVGPLDINRIDLSVIRSAPPSLDQASSISSDETVTYQPPNDNYGNPLEEDSQSDQFWEQSCNVSKATGDATSDVSSSLSTSAMSKGILEDIGRQLTAITFDDSYSPLRSGNEMNESLNNADNSSVATDESHPSDYEESIVAGLYHVTDDVDEDNDLPPIPDVKPRNLAHEEPPQSGRDGGLDSWAPFLKAGLVNFDPASLEMPADDQMNAGQGTIAVADLFKMPTSQSPFEQESLADTAETETVTYEAETSVTETFSYGLNLNDEN